MRIHKARSAVVILSLLAAAQIGTATAADRSIGTTLDDSIISGKVEAAMVRDKQVSALDINVTTYRGVVQLSGFADSKEEAQRAVEIAKQVEGVESVKNAIRTRDSVGKPVQR